MYNSIQNNLYEIANWRHYVVVYTKSDIRKPMIVKLACQIQIQIDLGGSYKDWQKKEADSSSTQP